MMEPPPSAPAGLPKKTMGRYELLALLAMGGMAEIYLARLTGLRGFERLAVVKRIRPHLAREPRFVEMFIHEARLAARLNHANIVQIYDLGRDGDDLYIAMEYLDGENLAYLVQRCAALKRPLPFELAAGILAQVCDGLDHAHALTDEAGNPLHLVHRDVSPQNVIVQYDGQVKLVDFGIAKAAGSSSTTKVGTLKGKVAYMSPEQCCAAEMDGRSDVFSLGIILWELLARRRLYKRDHDVATLHAIVYGPLTPVRSVRPEVPRGLDRVASRALEKEPGKRFATAGEMGEALREALREAGLRCGPRDVSAMMGEVFAERALRRRLIVEQALATDGRQVEVGELKQDTGESMPSGSHERLALELPPGTIDPGPEEGDEEVRDTEMGTRPGAPASARPPVGEAQEPPDTAVTAPGKRTGERPAGGTLSMAAVGAAAAQEPPASGAGRFRLVAAILGGLALVLVLVLVAVLPGPEGVADAGVELDASGAVAALEVDAADAGVALAAPDAGLAVAAPDAGAPAPAAVPPARVAVETMPPGCAVSLDGRALAGTTPLEGIDLTPEVEHVFVVRCAGHEPVERAIRLAAGEGELLEFSPRALPGATQRPLGFLNVNSQPWSEVYLGRRKLGTTPLLRARLPAGRYNLVLVNPGMNLRKIVPVSVRAGKTTTLVEKL